MVTTIRSLREYTQHIRAAQTIDDISYKLELFMDNASPDYEDEFLENYIGDAKKLLDDFSKELHKMAGDEIVPVEKGEL